MSARELAEATGAKLTMPSRSLLDGGKYVPHLHSQIGKRMGRVTSNNPSGAYPGPITNCNLGPDGSEQEDYEHAEDR